jgi:hypothetical protein
MVKKDKGIGTISDNGKQCMKGEKVEESKFALSTTVSSFSNHHLMCNLHIFLSQTSPYSYGFVL